MPAHRRYLPGWRPEIAGDVVDRVPRCLAGCQPVSPVRPRHTAPAPPLVKFPVTQKALSLPRKGRRAPAAPGPAPLAARPAPPAPATHRSRQPGRGMRGSFAGDWQV